MSGRKLSKSDIILNKALELFNVQGLVQVGVRELARSLNVKPGNITYYFPTKNDIVLSLIERLSKEVLLVNSDINANELYGFLEQQLHTLKVYYKYRALVISFPSIIVSMPKYQQKYIDAQEYRQQKLAQKLNALLVSGYFDISTFKIDRVSDQLTLLSHYWLSECLLNGVILDEVKVCNGYIIKVLGVFDADFTFKGNLESERFKTKNIK